MPRLFVTAKKNYTKPGHPTFLGGQQSLKSYYGKKLSSAEIKEILSSNYSYSLHREYKKPRVRNPYYVYYIRQMAQLDLIQIENWGGVELPPLNDNVRFLCVLIDCFTRKMWVEPMINKTKKSALNAIQSIMEKVLSKPPHRLFETCLLDRGNEFVNTHVKSYFKELGTKMIHPNTPIKAGIVERANRSLQSLIYRYLTENETNKYIDVLPKLLDTYNSRGHRSLGYMSPNQAELVKNHKKVLEHQLKHISKIKEKQSRVKQKLLQVGDIVRKHNTKRNIFARGYHWQQEPEYYKIIKVHTRMHVPMYTIKSMDTKHHLRRKFYREELVKLTSDIYRIERVLDRRTRAGKNQVLVKWQFFERPSWIEEDNIIQTFVRE
jgi:hypothetical protein